MKRPRIFAPIIAAMLASLILKAAESAVPNVVLIFADDLGYGDLGCYGATKVQTPHIDQLAAEGKRFTDAHSASAVCTPSRYALLSGEYPLRANGGEGVWGPLSPISELVIDVDQLTLADVFKNKGYSTAVIGKWHLGFGIGETDWQKPPRPGPLDLGFDYFYGIPLVNSGPPFVYVENDRVVGGDPNDPLVHLGPGTHPEATPVTPIPPEAGRRTPNRFKGGVEAHKRYNDYTVGEVLAGKAVEWIAEKKRDPFFLYLSTSHIHHPFTPGKRFQGTSEAGLYGDFIHELDWMVGEVLQSLEDNGLAENTLVIFTSDNGGMFNIGGQAAFNRGHRQNGSLLGFKFGAWEGGHRVPFIARWPGRIEAGTVSSELICNVDLMATMAALTGQSLEKDLLGDSVNVLPALMGEPTAPLRDHLVLAPRQPTHLSLRRGRWMYIGAQGSGGFTGGPGVHAAGGPKSVSHVGSENSDIIDGEIREDAPPAQLYDLEADLSQTTNLYRQFPEVVKEMEAILKSYRPKS